MKIKSLFSVALLAGLPAPSVLAGSPSVQDEEVVAEFTLRVQPGTLELSVGDKARIEAWVEDGQGARQEEQVFFFSRSRRSVTVDREGNVEALRAGTFVLVARTRGLADQRLSKEVTVTIAPPPVENLELVLPAAGLYTGTSAIIEASGVDASGAPVEGAPVSWEVSDSNVAQVDAFGQVHGIRPGTVQLTAVSGNARVSQEVEVLPNPIESLSLRTETDRVRTGDVVHLDVEARDAQGQMVEGVGVLLTFLARPDDDLGSRATGQIEQDGRFVAEAPGLYTIVATSGTARAQLTIRAEPRNMARKVELLGRGEVHDSHTSDLWVWEGVDGRDYAVTGTWGANGEAHFWDVTDPTEIQRIATVKVDARTVNDVKVSEDGRLCVISREGASNRKNGMVLYDVTDPSNPVELTAYDHELTGGVHNVYIADDHVYALSAGRRYDIINVADPREPQKVGSYELDTPGHSIHDVWVTDGIAYSSNWGDGIHLVDVGNGVAGGSPSNPVPIAHYAYPSGWNHAAFPWYSESAEKFYVVGGDEAFPFGLNTEGKPTYPRGWLHFVDFTDGDNPDEVARYQVPEAGSHNFWIEDDICYAAFYNGGLRVIDISGELLGDLYHQGREIAWYLPTDPEGYVANAPMVWGPQPYKGNIFFSDWNTGLWCVRLGEPRR